MSKARLIITAVVLEGRSQSEVARDYDVSRYWVHQLVRRYHAEGEAAYEPRSRRPHTSPRAVPAEVEDQIVRLRKDLARQGLDAGADTIRTHLARRTPRSTPADRTDPPSASPTVPAVPAVATIWRILVRRGFVTPQPQKRPRSSYRIDQAGTVTVRHNSRLHHIGLGRGLAGTPVTMLIDDLHIRVIHRHTGELIRELTLDPTRDFQPRGLPPGPPKKSP
jgi:transposase-like protein